MKVYWHFLLYLTTVIVMAGMLFSGIRPAGLTPFFLLGIGLALLFLSSITGFVEKNIIKFSFFNCAIQLGYFFLDFGTVAIADKNIYFASLQLINFSITGLLLAIILMEFQRFTKSNQINSIAGLFEKNQLLGIGLVIAAFSLGGLPAFNIFVGEYFIYFFLFSIHPFLAMLTVFGSLIVFLFYARAAYIVFAGDRPSVQASFISKALVLLLSLASVVLGIVPQIFLAYLEMMA